MSWKLNEEGAHEKRKGKTTYAPLNFLRTSVLLSHGARLLYIMIKSHLQKRNCSQKFIRKDFRVSDASFEKYMRELKHFGFIKCTVGKDTTGAFVITKYTLYSASQTFPVYIMELTEDNEAINKWSTFKDRCHNATAKDLELLNKYTSLDELLHPLTSEISTPKNWGLLTPKKQGTIVECIRVVSTKDSLSLVEEEEKGVLDWGIPEKVNVSNLQSTDTVLFKRIETIFMQAPFNFLIPSMRKNKVKINRALREGSLNNETIAGLVGYFTTCRVSVPDVKTFFSKMTDYIEAYAKVKLARLQRKIDSCFLTPEFLEESGSVHGYWSVLVRITPKTIQECDKLVVGSAAAEYITTAIYLTIKAETALANEFLKKYQVKILANFQRFAFTTKKHIEVFGLTLNQLPMGGQFVRVYEEKMGLYNRMKLVSDTLHTGERVEETAIDHLITDFESTFNTKVEPS